MLIEMVLNGSQGKNQLKNTAKTTWEGKESVNRTVRELWKVRKVGKVEKVGKVGKVRQACREHEDEKLCGIRKSQEVKTVEEVWITTPPERK